MPPIPVHLESPIAPKTDFSPAVASQPAEAATTAAIPPTTTQAYPAARPGQASVPAPTSAVPKPQPQPTRTYVSAEQAGQPPRPQPGPVPNPGAFQATTTSNPPPPTASNNAYIPPTVTSAPAQAQWAPPQQNYASTHTTDPSTPQRGPTTVNLGPVSSPAAHPAGYQQNVYAQELTSQQRASLDQQEAREKQDQPFSVLSTQQGETAENVWGAVKNWGSKAGEAAAKVHGEAWKWIDGKK